MIDLSSAYYEIMLDDAAQEICVINTRLRLFKILKLPQGMKNASEMFRRICSRKNKKSMCKRWSAIQDQLKDKGFTIN